jgi:hypothetical protein
MKDNTKAILLTTAGILLAFAILAGVKFASNKWKARKAATAAAAAAAAAAKNAEAEGNDATA